MGHRAKLGGSLFLTLVALGCLAVGYSLAWYKVQYTPTVGSQLNTYYWWTKYTTTDADGNNSNDTKYTDSEKNVKQVFTVSLSFLTGAAAAGLATAIFQVVGIISKSRFFRILSGIAALAIFALLGVAFFTFFGINKAFDNDNACLLTSFNDDFCRTFRGTGSNTVTGEIKFGPWAGWFVCIGALVSSLLSAITSFMA